MPKPSAHQFIRDPRLPHLELRASTDSQDCYETHTHDEYAFGTIDAGRAVYCHGAHRTALRPGMTVMMEPGLAHACNPDLQQPWSYRMLFVDAQWVHRSFVPFAPGQPQRLKLSGHSSDAPSVYRALGRIAEALAAGAAADPLEVDERLLGFLAQHALQPRAAPATPIVSADQQALQAVRTLICAQVDSNLSLDQLAAHTGWSEYQLIRKFKQAFGQTPHAFLIDQRLNHAKRLLKDGMGLADVAHQVGFADQAHFQRHFRKRHATTPGNYLG